MIFKPVLVILKMYGDLEIGSIKKGRLKNKNYLTWISKEQE